MATYAHSLKKNVAARPGKVRVGRGDSKHGNYSGKGIKGQRARTGGRKGITRRAFMQNLRNVPKSRGFKSLQTKPLTITTGMLESTFAKDPRKLITPITLMKKGLVEKPFSPVKIVVKGDLKTALTVKGCLASADAKAAIEKAGGSVAL